MTASRNTFTIAGAGILGLWQALTLARSGKRVRLVEASAEPFVATASRFAGAMLAPYCEGEAAPPIVRDQGVAGLKLWREAYPGLVNAGSLVLAGPRDRSELTRYQRLTTGHTLLDDNGLTELEPELAGRFGAGLYFADEAHMATPAAMSFLLEAVRACGAEVRLGSPFDPATASDGDGIVIDCRGMAGQSHLLDLRGVRGERLVVRAPDVSLSRPVRLLHPRHPIYVVPWGDGRFVVGATVIESAEGGEATVRSVLELLGTAYALTPAFAEAEIIDVGAGVRPAYADNVPRARVAAGGRRVDVNGAYRHGFLLAPVLAQAVAAWAENPASTHPLLQRSEPM